MSKTKLFNKGDVILTNPNEGFWGIGIVLSESEEDLKCHIAITPLIYKHEVKFDELDIRNLKPLEFSRKYKLENIEEFTKKEICIGVYSRKNKYNLNIIGKVDSTLVYNGPLPFEPWHYLEIKWPLCGFAENDLGREAYLNWKNNS